MAKILWGIFASIFKRQIGLKLSFIFCPLYGLGISIILDSEDELGSVPSVSIFFGTD